MNQSLAVVEYKSVAVGIMAADAMVKAAPVDLVKAQSTCPGKFVVLVAGKLSAVKAAFEAAKAPGLANALVDTYFLGNPHELLLQGLSEVKKKGEHSALAVLEGHSVASVIGAVDEMLKAAPLSLIEIRVANGLGGKSFALLGGEVAALELSMAKAKSLLPPELFVEGVVIANPDMQVWEKL